jgi:hypothetical protein
MSNTPIWDETSTNLLLLQKSAYERGRIETRLAIVDKLKAATKKPPVYIVKLIKELESNA